MNTEHPNSGASAPGVKPTRMPLRSLLLATGSALPAPMLMGNHAFIRSWSAKRAQISRLPRLRSR